LKARIQVSNDPSGRRIVFFPDDPFLISKIKTIDVRRWLLVEQFGIFKSHTDVSMKSIGKIINPLDSLNLKGGCDV
jgi:hypothetical protein